MPILISEVFVPLLAGIACIYGFYNKHLLQIGNR